MIKTKNFKVCEAIQKRHNYNYYKYVHVRVDAYLSDCLCRCGHSVEESGDNKRMYDGNGVKQTAASMRVGISSVLNDMSALQKENYIEHWRNVYKFLVE